MTPFIVALIVTFALMPPTIALLRGRNLLDVPNARSSHVRATPRGGGVALAVGVAAGTVVAGVQGYLVVVLATAGCAALVGLGDDVFGLPPLPRLGLQTLIAFGAAAGLLWSRDAPLPVLVMGVAPAAIWMVGCLNAVNFMDGVNGMSGLTAAVAGGWFAWLGGQMDHHALTLTGLALVGAAIGFLPWNAVRAKVFLGDVGSYGVGMLLAAMSLLALLEGATVLQAVAPLSVYLADTGWTLARRVRRGATWHEAHREHVYQRLVIAGWPHPAVACLAAVLALAICLLSVNVPIVAALVGTVVLLCGYLAMPSLVTPNSEVTV